MTGRANVEDAVDAGAAGENANENIDKIPSICYQTFCCVS